VPGPKKQRAAWFGTLLVTAGGVVVLTGSLMPWLRSGSRDRNSFQLYSVLRHLDAADDLLSRVVLRAWPLLPLALAVTAVLAWAGWRRASAVIALVAASEVVIACAAARRSALTSRPGIGVSFVGASLLIVGAVLLLSATARAARARPSALPDGPS